MNTLLKEEITPSTQAQEVLAVSIPLIPQTNLEESKEKTALKMHNFQMLKRPDSYLNKNTRNPKKKLPLLQSLLQKKRKERKKPKVQQVNIATVQLRSQIRASPLKKILVRKERSILVVKMKSLKVSMISLLMKMKRMSKLEVSSLKSTATSSSSLVLRIQMLKIFNPFWISSKNS